MAPPNICHQTKTYWARDWGRVYVMYYLKGLNRHSFVDCSFFDKAGIAKMALGFLSEKMLDYWWLFQNLKKYFFNLQCCTPFFCTAKWLIFTHTYTFFFTFFSIKVYHQFSSVGHSCLTLCDPMDFSIPGFPDHYQLLELTQLMSIESVMPSNILNLCFPLFILPSIFPASGSFQMSQFFTSGG